MLELYQDFKRYKIELNRLKTWFFEKVNKANVFGHLTLVEINQKISWNLDPLKNKIFWSFGLWVETTVSSWCEGWIGCKYSDGRWTCTSYSIAIDISLGYEDQDSNKGEGYREFCNFSKLRYLRKDYLYMSFYAFNGISGQFFNKSTRLYHKNSKFHNPKWIFFHNVLYFN